MNQEDPRLKPVNPFFRSTDQPDPRPDRHQLPQLSPPPPLPRAQLPLLPPLQAGQCRMYVQCTQILKKNPVRLGFGVVLFIKVSHHFAVGTR
jgi:hypothetical protein